MSDQLPACPKCQEEYTYESGALLVCPMCGHEWSAEVIEDTELPASSAVIRDAVGNVLNDGDTVTIVKDLKVKGAGGTIKVGTKVTEIRLIEDGIDDHDIDARVPGFGNMQLKSSVVKKAT
ncbi:MAG TPA: zinc ribbon domain-containing protein YjdM [Enteractinococcus sp.]